MTDYPPFSPQRFVNQLNYIRHPSEGEFILGSLEDWKSHKRIYDSQYRSQTVSRGKQVLYQDTGRNSLFGQVAGAEIPVETGEGYFILESREIEDGAEENPLVVAMKFCLKKPVRVRISGKDTTIPVHTIKLETIAEEFGGTKIQRVDHTPLFLGLGWRRYDSSQVLLTSWFLAPQYSSS